MAGQLTISTLKSDTGVLATQNGMTGIAKAWVNFNGTTATIRSSFNVGSVTRTATGEYTVNFTTAMPDANYVVVLSAATVSGGFGVFAVGTLTTASFNYYQNRVDVFGRGDSPSEHVTVFSA